MKKTTHAVSNLENLTNQELEVLRWIARGASDQDIAQTLFLSVNTIKWHNRNIYAKLGVQSRTQAVYEAGRRNLLDHVLETPIFKRQDPKVFLPAEVSSFVGRKNELPGIKEALQSARLLTLTGPGGVGKTRLALSAAIICLEEGNYADGVYWIDLSTNDRPAWVPDLIAEGLRLTPGVGCSSRELLSEFLYDKELLLVIDNFEHLLPAAPLIHDLLVSSPQLKVLTTSREALQLSGEVIYQIPPMEVPDPAEKTDPSELIEIEGVKLFLERAKTVNHKFAPVGDDLDLVTSICNHLDGLPLAIELAAAQIRYFNLREISDQLTDRFDLLAEAPRDVPDRHKSLAKAMDWSYKGLTEDEKTLFNRLSVFQNGRTIDAVDAVCCFDLKLDVLDGMKNLVDKNLIRLEEGLIGEPRFFLLETLHEYGRLRLKEAGETSAIQLRHAVFFADLAEKAKYPLRGGPEQVRWLRKIREEHENVRIAFDWSMAHGYVDLGSRMVAGLGFFWLREFHFQEGIRWTDLALKQIDRVSPEIQAGVYCSAGIAAFYRGDFDRMDQMAEKAIEINLLLEDDRELGWIYAFSMNSSLGDPAKDQKLNRDYIRAIEIFDRTDEKVGKTIAHYLMAIHKALLDDLKSAKRYLRQSWDISEEIGDQARQVMILIELACFLMDEKKFQLAQDVCLGSLKQETSLGTKADWASGTLFYLARTAIHLGDPQRGIQLLAAAYDIFDTTDGLTHPDFTEADFSEIKELALTLIDQQVLDQAWQIGIRLGPEKAIELAFEAYDPDVDLSQAWQ